MLQRAQSILSDPYLIAVVIPLVLIACGACAKKLVRGSTWRAADFYLGVELALAALASAMVYVFDITKLNASPGVPVNIQGKLAATSSFLALCFFTLLWLLSTHQDWEKRTQNLKGQVIVLGLLANAVGALLLTAFVLLVKGID